MGTIENQERILDYAKRWIVANSKDQNKAQICMALIETIYSDIYENYDVNDVDGTHVGSEHKIPKVLWEESSDQLDWFLNIDAQEYE